MERIASFSINHDILTEGIYTSRTDGDVVTYDIRMEKPNKGTYLEMPVMHTIEHLFATYARNSSVGDKIIYIGPMGCRTGFYMLVRDMEPAVAIKLVQDSMAFMADYTGKIPGAKSRECGNYREHDLEGTKRECARMAKLLEGWSVERLVYPE